MYDVHPRGEPDDLDDSDSRRSPDQAGTLVGARSDGESRKRRCLAAATAADPLACQLGEIGRRKSGRVSAVAGPDEGRAVPRPRRARHQGDQRNRVSNSSNPALHPFLPASRCAIRPKDELDAERLKREMTWPQVAREIGCGVTQVPALSRIRYDVNMRTAMGLVAWLKRPAADFIVGSE